MSGGAKAIFGAALDVADPLILFVQHGQLPEAGAFLGIEALVAYMRSWLESWSEFTLEAEDIIDGGGGTVVATVRQHGVGRGSGAETRMRYFQVWSFRGGKAIRLENFVERSEALEAAGLSE